MPATLSHGAYAAPTASTASTPVTRSTWGQAVWRFLLQVGANRAAPHIEAIARQYEHTDPALARQMREHLRHGLVD